MKITPTMMRVLRAVEAHPDCGARTIDYALWPDRHFYRPLRAGQYAGRLCRLGLLRKSYEEFRGKRGQVVGVRVIYWLSPLAREILKSEM